MSRNVALLALFAESASVVADYNICVHIEESPWCFCIREWGRGAYYGPKLDKSGAII